MNVSKEFLANAFASQCSTKAKPWKYSTPRRGAPLPLPRSGSALLLGRFYSQIGIAVPTVITLLILIEATQDRQEEYVV